MGTLLSTLDTLRLRHDTLVIFTSDNGPSLLRQSRGGCAGLLRCGKGTTWEGGVRVPTAISYPALLPPGRLTRPVSSLAVFPTVLAMVDRDHTVLPIASLLSDTLTAEKCLLYFPEAPQPTVGPYAIRCGSYKAHVYTEGSSLSDDSNPDPACGGSASLTLHSPPLLYNLDSDPGER